jgi:hypothetical protein
MYTKWFDVYFFKGFKPYVLHNSTIDLVFHSIFFLWSTLKGNLWSQLHPIYSSQPAPRSINIFLN